MSLMTCSKQNFREPPLQFLSLQSVIAKEICPRIFQNPVWYEGSLDLILFGNPGCSVQEEKRTRKYLLHFYTVSMSRTGVRQWRISNWTPTGTMSSELRILIHSCICTPHAIVEVSFLCMWWPLSTRSCSSFLGQPIHWDMRSTILLVLSFVY